MKKNFLKKIVSVAILILIIVVGTVSTPQRTYADFPVIDFFTGAFAKATSVFTAATAGSTAISAGGTTALVTKGYVLDPLAWAVAKSLLNSVVQSTVKWINSGFQGSPAFVTNLNATMLTTANSTAGTFLSQLATNGSIKSPFQNQVASAVSNSYNSNTNGGFFTSNPYTLNKTTSSDAAFFNGNFVAGGGLNTWANAWTSMANNPFGASLLAQGALVSSVSTAQTNQKNEITAGQGFLSYKGNCNSNTTTSSSGSKTTNLSGTNTCANASVQTPGSVIKDQLDKSLGSGVDQLVSANQLDEIVNALIGQLTKQVLGPSGLSGLTQSSSVTGGSSYIDQVSAAQSSVSGTLASSFIGSLQGQLTPLQTFLSEWQTIDTQTLAAQTALSQSTCYPNAQNVISTQIQPVLSEAATEISDAQTSIATIQNIENEVNIATSTNSSTELSQASNDYTNFLESPTLPSQNDIQNAQIQSQSSGTTTPESLYSQMTDLINEASTCTVTPATSETITTTPPPTGT